MAHWQRGSERVRETEEEEEERVFDGLSAHRPTRRRCDSDATRMGQWAPVDDADATNIRKMQFLNILSNSVRVIVSPPTDQRDGDENDGQIANDNRLALKAVSMLPDVFFKYECLGFAI